MDFLSILVRCYLFSCLLVCAYILSELLWALPGWCAPFLSVGAFAIGYWGTGWIMRVTIAP